MTSRRFLLLASLAFSTAVGRAQTSPAAPTPALATAPEPAVTQHPALFLVGDSIMKTGTNDGVTGPWGMGYEIIPLFDPAKIHVYNEGAGGRSSRSYGDEGLWAKIVARLQPGDFIIMMFGHNDAANSANYPERTTITGNGEETLQVGVGDKKKTVHTYGWYLRQYVQEAKGKGVTVILCSQIPRNTWSDGHIKRGFDGYAQWAREAAQASGAFFIDLNRIAADHYDAMGQAKTATYFNDVQHTKKAGARVNAECVVEGVRGLTEWALKDDLLPAAGMAHP